MLKKNMVTRLSEILKRGSNNFDSIRLVAALAVMLGHSYGLQNPSGNPDVIKNFLGIEYPGSLAVYAFFITSGLLIAQSFERQRNPIRFCVLRFARIWPGLCVNVLITICVIGPIFSNFSTLTDYFSSPGTTQYLLTNLGHFGGVESFVPGLFMHSASPNAVNFPLWTLPVEVQCYAMVLFLGVLGILFRKWVLLFILALSGPVYLALAPGEPHWIFTVYFFHKMDGYSFYPVPFFMLGVACYAFKDWIPLSRAAAIFLAVSYLALRHSHIGPIVFYAAYAYGILVIASLKSLAIFRRKNDYSYGIYIYGFVCQQIVADTWPKMDNYMGLLVSIPLTLLFAFASWHLVEKRAIAYARRLTEDWKVGDLKFGPTAIKTMNPDTSSDLGKIA